MSGERSGSRFGVVRRVLGSRPRERILDLVELVAWLTAGGLVGTSPGIVEQWRLALWAIPFAWYLATGSLPMAWLRSRFHRVDDEGAGWSSYGPVSGRRSEREEQWQNTRWTRNTLLSILAIGLLGLGGFAWSQGGWSTTFWAIFSSGLLIGGAAFLVGAMLGFLFGIPRTLQGDGFPSQERDDTTGTNTRGRGADRDDETRYLVNTNLQQISDWLTKIIVGIGLVELRRIPELMNRLARYLQEGLSLAPGLEPATLPFPRAALISMVVFFVTDGFLAGYLMTRLFLARAFQQADHAGKKIEAAANAARSDLANADNEAPISTKYEPTSPVPKAARRGTVAELVRKVEAEGLSPTDLDIEQADLVATAYYHLDQYSRAIPFFERVWHVRRFDPEIGLKLAISRGESGFLEPAVTLLKELREHPYAPPVTNKLLGYYLLWRRDRLNESIESTEQYLESFPRDGGARFNLACAHAQLYGLAVEREEEAAASEAAKHRKIALTELRTAIRLEPIWKARAADLAAPGYDFESLADNPDFLELLA